MDSFIISGIQQVGVGTKDIEAAWKWYANAFDMHVQIFRDQAPAQLMYSYTGGEIHKRDAMLILNRHGGGGLEVWQYLSRPPQSPYEGIVPGDYGVYATRIKCVNILPTYDSFYSRGFDLLNEPQEDPAGNMHFFLCDPTGNIFDIYEGKDWFIKPARMGGVAGVMIGVSDIDRSLPFYCDLLGFKEKLYDVDGVFPDFIGLPKQTHRYRRVLLCHKGTAGPFGKFLGNNYIELVAVLDKEKKRKPIYEGRLWGDPGFIHLCFDVVGMDTLLRRTSEMGFPARIDSQNSFSMQSASGRFVYIEDPDLTPIELVETHHIPIHRGLNLHLNLRKRKPAPLPRFMLRMMRFQEKHPDS